MPSDFRILNLESHYSSSIAQMLDDFYLPVLSNSKTYDRAAGFFSSAIFAAIEVGLSNFVVNGGKMRLICSPFLSLDDANAITDGLNDQQVGDNLNKQISDWNLAVGSTAPSSILRHMVSNGVIDIRIAVPLTARGMFHDKFGIFTSDAGDKIAFEGSINESLNGWTAYGNHEHFSIFVSWDDRVRDRVNYFDTMFSQYWHNLARGLRILDASRLPEVFKVRDSDLTEKEALEKFKAGRRFRKAVARGDGEKPGKIDLQPHQILAIDNWEKQGKRGIIDFVTGGGKTLTALAIARSWLETNCPVLVLVPSELLVEQWIEEIDREIDLTSHSLIQVGAGVGSKEWAPLLRAGLEKTKADGSVLIIATYDSARTESFLFQIETTSPEILIIADEVHAIGAAQTRVLMERINARARLGLSATPERFGDEIGTKSIFEYFGEKLEPSFGITEAIAAGRLVEYNYSIHTVHLTEDETSRFDELTAKIGMLLAWSKGEIIESSWLDKLRRDRAAIVKQAENKISLAIDVLSQNIHRFSHWLVYCNSLEQIAKIQEHLKIRKIDNLEYHSKLSRSAREQTLTYFERHGGVLIAVHCLDQGVDIPRINAAIIIASSTNPREYIQRRGRILRYSPGKYFADMHDTVTLTSRGDVALETDIRRAAEIASHAKNRERALITLSYLVGTIDATRDDSFEGDIGDV